MEIRPHHSARSLVLWLYMIGSWDCESNREIVFVSFVHVCVRAGGRGEAVCACETLLLLWLGG